MVGDGYVCVCAGVFLKHADAFARIFDSRIRKRVCVQIRFPSATFHQLVQQNLTDAYGFVRV